jgi:hypothetical protein
LCELDADVESRDNALAEVEAEIAYYKRVNEELSEDPTEQLMRLRRDNELAEATIRHLYEDNQRA